MLLLIFSLCYCCIISHSGCGFLAIIIKRASCEHRYYQTVDSTAEVWRQRGGRGSGGAAAYRKMLGPSHGQMRRQRNSLARSATTQKQTQNEIKTNLNRNAIEPNRTVCLDCSARTELTMLNVVLLTLLRTTPNRTEREC